MQFAALACRIGSGHEEGGAESSIHIQAISKTQQDSGDELDLRFFIASEEEKKVSCIMGSIFVFYLKNKNPIFKMTKGSET